MLHRTKTAQIIATADLAIFKKNRSLAWLTQDAWQQMVSQQAFIDTLAQASACLQLPAWQGSLADITIHRSFQQPYQVVAVDGSQIYPDHHLQGVDCFLVNVGYCHLAYGEQSSARLDATPHLLTSLQAKTTYKQNYFAADMVDLIREDYELALLVQLAQALTLHGTEPLVGLFDGNVFFWHLGFKMPAVKDVFFARYATHLIALYEQRFLYAGYLSGTQFADVVALVRAGLCEGTDACGLTGTQLYDLCSMLDGLSDADLLATVLAPGERTTLFACTGSLAEAYPAHSKPWFFYLNAGEEVVRIEVPAWIAHDAASVATIAECALDQSIKGFGYPVALAEAHAQAVVAGADRLFFYQLLQAHSVARQRQVVMSPKSMKKKVLGV